MRYVPQLGLGIVTLGNVVPAANQVDQLLVYEIVDNLLCVDGSARFDQEEARVKMLPLPVRQKRLFGLLSDSARPSPMPMQDHTGTYWNAGYGEVTVSIRAGDPNTEITKQTDNAGQSADQFLQVTPIPRTLRWTARLTQV